MQRQMGGIETMKDGALLSAPPKPALAPVMPDYPKPARSQQNQSKSRS
jgi:hypothetical protein